MTLVMLLFSVLNLKFSMPVLLGLQLLFYVLVFYKYPIKFRWNLRDIIKLDEKEGRSFRFEKFVNLLFIFIVYVNVRFVVVTSAGLPYVHWDAWAQWGFKAKIFFDQKIIPFSLFSDPAVNMPNQDYPLLASLVQSYVFIFMGRAGESWGVLCLSLYYFCILVIFYYFAKCHFSRCAALAFTAYISSSYLLLQIAVIGYADIVVCAFLLAAIIEFLRYFSNGAENCFTTGAWLLGLTAWAKQEGAAYWLIVTIFFVFLSLKDKRQWNRVFYLVASYCVINFMWWAVVILVGVSHARHLLGSNFIFYTNLLDRFFEALKILFKYFSDYSVWNFSWYIFLIFLTFDIIKRKTSLEKNFLVFIIFSSIAAICLGLSLDPVTPVRFLFGITMSRVAVQFFPLIFLYILLSLFPRLTGEQK